MQIIKDSRYFLGYKSERIYRQTHPPETNEFFLQLSFFDCISQLEEYRKAEVDVLWKVHIGE